MSKLGPCSTASLWSWRAADCFESLRDRVGRGVSGAAEHARRQPAAIPGYGYQMTEQHTAACFLRVDVRVDGPAQRDAYDALSERLQDLLQEAILAPADEGLEIDLQGMTCLVLGPVPQEETIAESHHEEFFAPVAEWLATRAVD
jgi:hypothetical protein